jgi:phosphoserine phosphatase
MPHVLTLVAAGILTTELATAVTAELRRRGARCAEPDWLAPRSACDLPFDHPEPAAVAAASRQVVAAEPVDLAVQPAAGRRKRLLVADLESTVIKNEMLDELAEIAGVGPRVAAITARAMNGEIGFTTAVRERLALLAGLPQTALARAAERIELDPGARALAATMRHHGAFSALVSGGFGCFAERVRAAVGFDAQRSNELEIADGRLSGNLTGPILCRDAKRDLLHGFCHALGIDPRDALAVGDGANDLPMLEAAGLGVAFHGKPSVARKAPCRVDHGDLTALLYFQGYREEEISTDCRPG